MLHDIELPDGVWDRLEPLLGKNKLHKKTIVYLNGNRRTTINIPDKNIVGEVKFYTAFHVDRAIFIDGKYIFKGHLTEEKCLEIESEL